MQLQIIDQQQNSFLFNNVAHVPRVGELVQIATSDYRGGMDDWVEGIVESVDWMFNFDSGDYTVTATLIKAPALDAPGTEGVK